MTGFLAYLSGVEVLELLSKSLIERRPLGALNDFLKGCILKLLYQKWYGGINEFKSNLNDHLNKYLENMLVATCTSINEAVSVCKNIQCLRPFQCSIGTCDCRLAHLNCGAPSNWKDMISYLELQKRQGIDKLESVTKQAQGLFDHLMSVVQAARKNYYVWRDSFGLSEKEYQFSQLIESGKFQEIKGKDANQLFREMGFATVYKLDPAEDFIRELRNIDQFLTKFTGQLHLNYNQIKVEKEYKEEQQLAKVEHNVKNENLTLTGFVADFEANMRIIQGLKSKELNNSELILLNEIERLKIENQQQQINNLIQTAKTLKPFVVDSSIIGKVSRQIDPFNNLVQSLARLKKQLRQAIKLSSEEIKREQNNHELVSEKQAILLRQTQQTKEECIRLVKQYQQYTEEEFKKFTQFNKIRQFFVKPIVNMKLLYRATNHQMKITPFHEACDNKGPTLLLIKTQQFKKIIGGFAAVSWESVPGGKWKQSPKKESFLFSLTNNEKLTIVANQQCEIQGNSDYGPIFGSGRDLCIQSESYRKDCECGLGLTYNNGTYSYTTQQTSERWVGQTKGNKFRISQWEVFSIQFL